MTRVYGSCVEPDGLELNDDRAIVKCPECGGQASERFWETCESGSINQNHTIQCIECGHADGDLPDDCYDDRKDECEMVYDAELDDVIFKLGY